jgi:hypothetical protein
VSRPESVIGLLEPRLILFLVYAAFFLLLAVIDLERRIVRRFRSDCHTDRYA